MEGNTENLSLTDAVLNICTLCRAVHIYFILRIVSCMYIKTEEGLKGSRGFGMMHCCKFAPGSDSQIICCCKVFG
jgi:hypothetical protein